MYSRSRTAVRSVAIVLLLQCLLSPFLVVAEQEVGSRVAVLSDGQEERSLTSRLEILEDPSGALGIAEITSAELASSFAPTGRQTLNLGYSSSAYRLRFRLRNKRTDPDALPLELLASAPGIYRQRGTRSLQRLFRLHFQEFAAGYDAYMHADWAAPPTAYHQSRRTLP